MGAWNSAWATEALRETLDGVAGVRGLTRTKVGTPETATPPRRSSTRTVTRYRPGAAHEVVTSGPSPVFPSPKSHVTSWLSPSGSRKATLRFTSSATSTTVADAVILRNTGGGFGGG